MFPAWVSSMQRAFAAQAEGISARGLRGGIRLTHTGNTYEHPRWIPANAWPGHAGDLLYYVDDQHTCAGHWALPVVRDAHGQVIGSREGDRELMVRINGPGAMSFMPDGALVFSSGDIYNNLFLFDDLFELPAGAKSPSGLDNRRVRWSEGWRALDPSMSPDGRRGVFTTNHRGTTRSSTRACSCPGSPSTRRSRRAGRPTADTSCTAHGSTAGTATSASSTPRTDRTSK
jgi:hypothetical protein